MILVSACLLGLSCRYDQKAKTDERVLAYLKDRAYIPVCPEQLGGLPTPRPKAEIQAFDPLLVLNQEGEDVTEAFERGAREVLKIARLFQANHAILKSKSPSCGSSQVYDGTFSGVLLKGQGVCSQLLRQDGIEVISERDLI